MTTEQAIAYALQERAAVVAAVRRLGIDEIALKKGHRQYALVLSDFDRGRVLTVLPDRTQETVEAHFDAWSLEQRSAVTDVALDLWGPSHLAVAARLPNARITGDRSSARGIALHTHAQRAPLDIPVGLSSEQWLCSLEPEFLSGNDRVSGMVHSGHETR